MTRQISGTSRVGRKKKKVDGLVAELVDMIKLLSCKHNIHDGRMVIHNIINIFNDYPTSKCSCGIFLNNYRQKKTKNHLNKASPLSCHKLLYFRPVFCTLLDPRLAPVTLY